MVQAMGLFNQRLRHFPRRVPACFGPTGAFKEAGSYPYFCKIHPMMTGTIGVERGA